MTKKTKCIALGVVVALFAFLFAVVAYAHPGGMAKDGCHNHRQSGERHWHIATTHEVGGKCVGGQKVMPLQLEFKQMLDKQTEQLTRLVQTASARQRTACWTIYRSVMDSWTPVDRIHDLVKAGCIVGVQME